MANVDDRIAQKKAELEKLQGQKRALEEKQKARANGEKRKAETTAKILLGAAALLVAKRVGHADLLEKLTTHLVEKDQKRLVAAFEVLGVSVPQPKPENTPTARVAPPAVKPTPSL